MQKLRIRYSRFSEDKDYQNLPCKTRSAICRVNAGIFTNEIGRGSIGTKWPCAAAPRPTINHASARKGTCGRSPSVPVQERGRIQGDGPGADNGRPRRAKVLALARAHEIGAILVTELNPWSFSTCPWPAAGSPRIAAAKKRPNIASARDPARTTADSPAAAIPGR